MDRPLQRIVYATLATVSGLVLLFGYRTSHGEEMTATAPAAGGSVGAPSDVTGSTSGGAGSTGSTGSTASSGLQNGTYTGDSAGTRYGPVQVQITVSGGSISAVDVLDYPSDNPRDRQINQRALPMLISETTSAQSARIDMISGATYTSEGYLRSLQSAIDQAQS
ncbi:FMN-binding protein [Microbacterium sp. OR21]|uniref:FMN-binding protein n=1 Tax=Microbacterium sp. OR21 TaxID=3095346 RepID=UPI0039B39EC0